MRTVIPCALFLLCVALTALPNRAFPEKKQAVRTMEFHSIIDDHHLPALFLVEYGLVEGITYDGRLKSEHYHLPPREPGGKPERRGKTVLLISDGPFPNDCELTPLYQGWSY